MRIICDVTLAISFVLLLHHLERPRACYSTNVSQLETFRQGFEEQMRGKLEYDGNEYYEVVERNVKCRNGYYPGSNGTKRFTVPNHKVSWDISWVYYQPVNFTSTINTGSEDLDIYDPNFQPKWNYDDGNVNRKSYTKAYAVVNKYPLNPYGRTGVTGRGVLPRWGPNYEVNIFITRWVRDHSEFVKDNVSNLPLVQLLASRKNKKGTNWSVPRGFLLAGEKILETMTRVFESTCLRMKRLTERGLDPIEISYRLNTFFSTGRPLYRGYVDDPRNTDNAWVEVVAMHCQDNHGQVLYQLPIGGHPWKIFQWLIVHRDLKLYGEQYSLASKISMDMRSHW